MNVIHSRVLSLKEVLIRFQSYDITQLNEFFTIRRQLNLGTYLFNRLFGSWLDRQPNKRISTEIYIITNDEFLLQLPWVLLADKGVFLASANWRICQSPYLPDSEIKSDHFMKILVVLPEPDNYPPTGGNNHYNSLKKLLLSIASDQISSQYLMAARTWEELENEIYKKPEIIYYYGHGIYYDQTSSIVLERNNKSPQIVPIVELRKLSFD